MSSTSFQLTRLAILIVGVILASFYASNNIITIDHVRMISRGYLAATEGVWTPFGNPASGLLGNIPGYLSTLVVAIPYVVSDSNYAPIVFLLILQLLAYCMFDNVLKELGFGSQTRIAFVLLFFMNPWVLHETVIWNPSYLFFFAALHCWTAIRIRNQSSFLYCLLHFLSVGFAAQIHFSALVLAFATIFLFYKNLIKINWFAVFSAILLVLISLVPFFLQVYENLSSLASTASTTAGSVESPESKYYFGRGLIEVYPLVKSMLYWVRYGSFLFTNQILKYAQFDWLSHTTAAQAVAVYLWRGLVYVVGLATVGASFYLNYRIFKHAGRRFFKPGSSLEEPSNASNTDWLSYYALCIFAAVVISAMLSPITFVSWHLLLAFFAALVPLLVFIERRSRQGKLLSSKLERAMVICIPVFLVLVNLVGSHDSQRFSYKVSFAQQIQQQLPTPAPEKLIPLRDI